MAAPLREEFINRQEIEKQIYEQIMSLSELMHEMQHNALETMLSIKEEYREKIQRHFVRIYSLITTLSGPKIIDAYEYTNIIEEGAKKILIDYKDPGKIQDHINSLDSTYKDFIALLNRQI